MTATAQPGAAPPGTYAPPAWAPRGWNPWALVWTVPKPVLIGAMVLAFILFWPLGLAALFFLIGSGRIGGRWSRRMGQDGAAWGRDGQPGAAWTGAGGCGWGQWRRDDQASSGNAAFDEYRLDTLRRLEEEQRDFAAFLERLRFAKDKSEFDQFMAERRQRPAAPPRPEPPPQG